MSIKDGKYDLDNVFWSLDDNSPIRIPQSARMEHGIMIGRTGSGKTTSYFLPCINDTLEVKAANMNWQKQRIFEMLQMDRAFVNKVFADNDFSIAYFTPMESGLDQFRQLQRDRASATVLVVGQDGSFADEAEAIAKNKNIKCYRIDPCIEDRENSIGFNPLFVSPSITGAERNFQIASKAEKIGEILNDLNESSKGSEAYFRNLNTSIIVTVCEVLMLVHPYLDNGKQPTLVDAYDILSDYKLLRPYIECLCELYGNNGEAYEYGIRTMTPYGVDCGLWRQEYEALMELFNSNKTDELHKHALGLRVHIRTLIDNPFIRKVLCSQDSIDLDDAVHRGSVILVNYARNLGDTISRAFGALFLLNFNRVILNRPKDGKGRNRNGNIEPPVFCFIDEFPTIIMKELEDMFTLHRGYGSSNYIAIQNIEQLRKNNSLRYFSDTVMSNTALQLMAGGADMEDARIFEDQSPLHQVVERHLTPYGYELESTLRPRITARTIHYLNFQECVLKAIVDGRVYPPRLARLHFLDKSEIKKTVVRHYSWDSHIHKSKTKGLLREEKIDFSRKPLKFFSAEELMETTAPSAQKRTGIYFGVDELLAAEGLTPLKTIDPDNTA